MSATPSLKPRATQRPFLAMMLRLMAACAITSMFALVKMLEKRGVNLAELMFYRQLFAVPVAWAMVAWTIGPFGFVTRNIGRHGWRTVLGLVGMALNFLSVMLLPLAESTTITFTAPIIATVFSAVVLREATGWHRWGAVMAGFVGVVIVAGPAGEHFPILGLVIGIASAVAVAMVTIVLRSLAQSEPSAVIVFWFSVLSLPPTGLLLLRYGQWHDGPTFALIVLLGVLGGVGQILLTSALRWGSVALVMPMDYSAILWASLFGWLFWDLLPPVSTWTGGSLIVASGLYIVWREHRLGRNAALLARAQTDISI